MLNPRSRVVRWLVAAAFVAVLPTASRAQNTCDVVVALDEPGPLSIIAYGLGYSGAGGAFMGSGLQPVCTRLYTGVENTIYDDDAGLLSNFVASQPGIGAPQGLISCVFALAGAFPCPAPGDFVVTDANFPPIGGVTLEDMYPGITPPALTISVSPRTPVCGDGFVEGTETCDDGNALDGDCCSSACAFEGSGEACDDGSVCTLGGTCDGAGTCVAASALACDDGDVCTTDTCDPVLGCQAAPVPASPAQCSYAADGTLDLRDVAGESKDKFQWSLSTHDALTPAVVGDPTQTTDYALCVYDETGNVPALVTRFDVPAGANWQKVGPSGTRYQYKDASRAADGVERLRVDGKPTKVKLELKGAKDALPLPGPVAPDRYFAADNEVTVQLRNSVGGCWSIGFRHPAENSAERVKAKE